MKIGREYTDAIGAFFSDNVYCSLVSLRCWLRGRNLKIFPHEDGHSYVAKFADERIYIARRNRFKRYDRGIKAWVERLAKGYCLDHVNFSKGDVVIDCGANIGEIGVWLQQFDVKYIPFEPEEGEAHCSDLNNFDGKRVTERFALWHEETVLEFFSKPDTADSSAIEIKDFTEVKRIKATSLAKYVEDHGIKSIKLFKVEAEGAEPEVLMGAEPVLGLIDYVSVDCGRERGIKQEATFEEANEILLKNNFERVTENKLRHVHLYKRR